MTNQNYQIDSLNAVMSFFLQTKARNIRTNNPLIPIVLLIKYQNSPKPRLFVIDSKSQHFSVNLQFLSSFEPIYTNPVFEVVSLNDWMLDLTFEGKTCIKIQLMSDQVTFRSKNQKKYISGCCFKIKIAESRQEAYDIWGKYYEPIGYLKRLGKRHLVQQSKNVAKQIKSLTKFQKIDRFKKKDPNDYEPWVRPEQPIIVRKALSYRGLKVLNKLRYFITREQIHNFFQQRCSEKVLQMLSKFNIKEKAINDARN